jgi:hypothetical protein
MRIFGSLCLLLVLAEWSAAQDTNFPVGPQYLITSGESLFLHPIATPSLSFGSQPALSEGAAEVTAKADEETIEAVSAVLDVQRQTFFPSVYYGVPEVGVVEIAFSEPAAGEASVSVPSSIFTAGVVEFISPQALRERGYGVTLAEAAARWKTHTLRARRVYTNEDVERLRPRD